MISERLEFASCTLIIYAPLEDIENNSDNINRCSPSDKFNFLFPRHSPNKFVKDVG